MSSAVPDAGQLLGLPADELSRTLDCDRELAERVAALLDGATAVAFELENLEQLGVTVVTPVDEGYPQRLVERLGHRAPPSLYAAGDLALLGRPGIGVVGSRGVDSAGAEVARSAARVAVRNGHTVCPAGPEASTCSRCKRPWSPEARPPVCWRRT